MKKSTKAVLFSLLVFPGTGHFLVEEFQRGLIWLSSAGILTFIITRNAINTAQKTVASLDLSGGLDLNQLMTTANQAAVQSGGDGWMNAMSWALGIIWIVAAVDVYRLAKAS